MTSEFTPLVIDSTFFADSKKIVKERIIPWEGLARSGVISDDDAGHMKTLGKQVQENRNKTVLAQLDLYSNSILNILNRLNVNEKEDIVKHVLALTNDLLLEIPEFVDTLLKFSSIDNSLPYYPFIKHLANSDNFIKTLGLYNLTILLTKASKDSSISAKIDDEIIIKIFDILSSPNFIGGIDSNYQFIGIQLLQELLIVKQFKTIYQNNNLVSNFKPINQLITRSATHPNATGLQLSYNILLATWILSFSAPINRVLLTSFPQLAGCLFTIAKDSIKLKIVRISVGILKNFVAVCTNSHEQFKVIKLLLFHDALNTIRTLQERKFASNGSDEELSNDLAYLSDNLQEVVTSKLTSFDEYMTGLENPKLISWASPTHKSVEFWLENSGKFKDSNYKLIKRIFEILITNTSDNSTINVILLNDLQFLIKNLGQELISFINTEKGGQYKLLIMSYLENNYGNNELKYEALKTIQLLVGHTF
ncbi:vacuolar ATPase V1 domain subunit H [Spathaspora passalidarum NRRL Y-27907]|uniref:V-type proton ATPase subunit H n=1 Tax=Spathaspora passalidarum (strain NRRL Y-27907 / 11-Y1) TaxID=619300 RepID=G3AHN4_SPAPN|nr:vacuolar ATPase V1 domain subunit H [Spathaspora passalidarum NRRL Y-27907]EGW34198.1 vacuolar ATPase V1 domain subunit H [Spathaspora passalidarum NRRL Y-27907]